MIRSIIVDDEKNNIGHLERLIQTQCPEIQVVASALDADEGKKLILQHDPQLIFLDIQMPEKNGFDLLRSLHKFDFEIIFVTAYDQYGIQAIKFAAIDYLLKPVNAKELKLAVGKVAEKISQKKRNDELVNLMKLLQQQQKESHRMALPTGHETRFVHPHEIVRCQSSNSYTLFFLESREKLMVSHPIFEYEALLKDYGFIRCHHSHLVNRAFVKSWIKNDGHGLLLTDGTLVPVSRQKKDAVSQELSSLNHHKI